jgi:hypothetical protein
VVIDVHGLNAMRAAYADGGAVRNPAARGLPNPSLLNLQLYAQTVAEGMYPDDVLRRDAARHMLAAALAAQRFGPGTAEALGKAYEFKESPLRTAGHWMGLSAPREDYPVDTHNNALGAQLGAQSRSMDDLLSAIQRAVDRGTAGIAEGQVSLRPDPDTRYVKGKARGGLAQVKERSCYG